MTQRADGRPPAVLVGYDAIVDALEADVDALGPGDRAILSVFLIEPGASSDRVLAAVAAAAARGARIEVRLDATIASRMQRMWEGTRTLAPRLHALARASMGRLRVRGLRTPDHAKFALFTRASEASSSVLVFTTNLGERFRAWRDVGLRAEGDAALRAVAEAVRGDVPPVLAGVPGGPPTVRAAGNAPGVGAYNVHGFLEAIFADPTLIRYRVAMAYLDRIGAKLIEAALDRGAAVEVILPGTPNVYPHANRKAVAALLARRGPRPQVREVPGMLHAKAFVAEDQGGPALTVVGSANLKRNSFWYFGEIAVAATAPATARALATWLDALASEAVSIEAPPTFRRLNAWVEERLG